MDWWVDEDGLGGLNHPKLGIELMCVYMYYIYIYWLVVWNMTFTVYTFMTFHSVGNGIIIPTDFNSIIFQRGRSTTNQYMYVFVWCWLYIWLAWNPLLKGCWDYDYTTMYHQYCIQALFVNFLRFYPGWWWHVARQLVRRVTRLKKLGLPSGNLIWKITIFHGKLSHRIGWWENLQETPIFDGKNM